MLWSAIIGTALLAFAGLMWFGSTHPISDGEENVIIAALATSGLCLFLVVGHAIDARAFRAGRPLKPDKEPARFAKAIGRALSALGGELGSTEVDSGAKSEPKNLDIAELAREIGKDLAAQRPSLTESAENKITEATAEAVRKVVSEATHEELGKLFGARETTTLLSGSRTRLLHAIDEQKARMSLQLGTGIAAGLFTTVTLVLLATILKTSDGFAGILARTGPVLVGSGITFFFLNLFRRGLDELRFLHNEISVFELRMAALASAASSGDRETLRDVVKALSLSERQRAPTGSYNSQAAVDFSGLADLVKAVKD